MCDHCNRTSHCEAYHEENNVCRRCVDRLHRIGRVWFSATPTPDASTSTQPLPAVVSASGKVLPRQWANLSFRTGGPIVELKAQSGETVKAGAVLARLDAVDAKLAVAQAEAALAVAQAQLSRNESRRAH